MIRILRCQPILVSHRHIDVRRSTNAAHTPTRFSKQESVRGKERHLCVVRYESFPAHPVDLICGDTLLAVFVDDHVERQKFDGIAECITDCAANQRTADLVQVLFCFFFLFQLMRYFGSGLLHRFKQLLNQPGSIPLLSSGMIAMVTLVKQTVQRIVSIHIGASDLSAAIRPSCSYFPRARKDVNSLRLWSAVLCCLSLVVGSFPKSKVSTRVFYAA